MMIFIYFCPRFIDTSTVKEEQSRRGEGRKDKSSEQSRNGAPTPPAGPGL
jgi:hypothetical protein